MITIIIGAVIGFIAIMFAPSIILLWISLSLPAYKDRNGDWR